MAINNHKIAGNSYNVKPLAMSPGLSQHLAHDRDALVAALGPQWKYNISTSVFIKTTKKSFLINNQPCPACESDQLTHRDALLEASGLSKMQHFRTKILAFWLHHDSGSVCGRSQANSQHQRPGYAAIKKLFLFQPHHTLVTHTNTTY